MQYAHIESLFSRVAEPAHEAAVPLPGTYAGYIQALQSLPVTVYEVAVCNDWIRYKCHSESSLFLRVYNDSHTKKTVSDWEGLPPIPDEDEVSFCVWLSRAKMPLVPTKPGPFHGHKRATEEPPHAGVILLGNAVKRLATVLDEQGNDDLSSINPLAELKELQGAFRSLAKGRLPGVQKEILRFMDAEFPLYAANLDVYKAAQAAKQEGLALVADYNNRVDGYNTDLAKYYERVDVIEDIVIGHFKECVARYRYTPQPRDEWIYPTKL